MGSEVSVKLLAAPRHPSIEPTLAATPVFHNDEPITTNQYGCDSTGKGWFQGAIYRALRSVDGVEVQDRAFNLATENFHFPKTHLVSLRGTETPPVAYTSSRVRGVPRWRQKVRETPVDHDLFPLHNPLNYVDWLGTQKKKVVVMPDVADVIS